MTSLFDYIFYHFTDSAPLDYLLASTWHVPAFVSHVSCLSCIVQYLVYFLATSLVTNDTYTQCLGPLVFMHSYLIYCMLGL